jgi:hypothetical protein
MKIPVTITAEIPFPQVVIEARREVFARINAELLSLNLPASELRIPRNGFNEFQLNDKGEVLGCLFNSERPGAYVARVRITWGSEHFARLLRDLDGMDRIARLLCNSLPKAVEPAPPVPPSLTNLFPNS